MKKPFTREAYNYLLWGILFGLGFPVVATIIEVMQSFGTLSLDNIIAAQSQRPLLWIIDSAPFVLGVFSFFIGQQLDRVHNRNQKILQTQEQLILQEQMASIGKMTAGIAHEIKNPLNFVTNFAESSVEISVELREALEERKALFAKSDYEYILELVNDLEQNSRDVQSNGERASRIVLSLMDQTRGSRKERKAINLNRVIDENINLAFHSFRTSHPDFNLDIQKQYTELPVPLMANPHSMGRVLLNIFNNACYALNEKKKVIGRDFTPVLLIQSKRVGDHVEICIRDNGTGIPIDIQKKIFEPFCTTKPSGEGNAGLGLSISLDIIVQEHGGDLRVESKPGEFTAFIIRLPLSRELAKVPAA